MARKGQSRVWAAGFAGFKNCPQHNTTPVQCDISCQPQRDTSHPESHPFMVVLTHSSPCLPSSPFHVTGCDMHTHTSHKFTLLWTIQPQAQLHSRDTMGQGPLCHHLPQDTPRTISRLELFQSLVNSGTSEAPQDGLTILLGSLEPLPQTLHRSCWHSVTQENVTWPGTQKTSVLVCPGLVSFLTLGKSASLSGLGC